jgi:hypothetical protein
MVWCPDCYYFGLDCNPDAEDYNGDCDSFKSIGDSILERASDIREMTEFGYIESISVALDEYQEFQAWLDELNSQSRAG